MSLSKPTERERLNELHRECFVLTANIADAEIRLKELRKKAKKLKADILKKITLKI